ncbi:hypothetical protein ACT9N5_11080 [Edwardsiella piscicida]|nr:hypothetical protein [Edwardsiella piscicida]ARD20086.1 hypothetical protein BXA22_08705 [Edwardsiella piscicida]MDM3866120.1 hypothetical protein [Edwardsiella piscicida]QHR95585.1 hypothetical protein GT752_10125 [Edwardsiella piscicida]UJT82426.1 hypothetical protein L1P07_16415 [Edwardsiella piscicida]UJT85695.1 hypothetical protein L1P05_16405 [Edwardsiella piscicida]
MKHTAIALQDLECLDHLRNVGQLVGELMQEQACVTVQRNPDQKLQLTSLIYLMTTQLDGVVERCNQRWLAGEDNV